MSYQVHCLEYAQRMLYTHNIVCLFVFIYSQSPVNPPPWGEHTQYFPRFWQLQEV